MFFHWTLRILAPTLAGLAVLAATPPQEAWSAHPVEARIWSDHPDRVVVAVDSDGDGRPELGWAATSVAERYPRPVRSLLPLRLRDARIAGSDGGKRLLVRGTDVAGRQVELRLDWSSVSPTKGAVSVPPPEVAVVEESPAATRIRLEHGQALTRFNIPPLYVDLDRSPVAGGTLRDRLGLSAAATDAEVGRALEARKRPRDFEDAFDWFSRVTTFSARPRGGRALHDPGSTPGLLGEDSCGNECESGGDQASRCSVNCVIGGAGGGSGVSFGANGSLNFSASCMTECRIGSHACCNATCGYPIFGVSALELAEATCECIEDCNKPRP